jgi:hypothetical protein
MQTSNRFVRSLQGLRVLCLALALFPALTGCDNVNSATGIDPGKVYPAPSSGPSLTPGDG